MPKFVLEIDLGGDAFEDEASVEIARILRATAEDVEADLPIDFVVDLSDINGLTCGTYRIKD